MKKLNNLFTLLSALLLLGACEKDGDTYFLSSPEENELIASASSVVLTKETAKFYALSLAWTDQTLQVSDSRYQPTSGVQTSVQVSRTEDFSGQILETTESGVSKTYSVSALNIVAYQLKATPEEEAPLYFRLAGRNGSNIAPVYSNVVKVMVTPYEIDLPILSIRETARIQEKICMQPMRMATISALWEPLLGRVSIYRKPMVLFGTQPNQVVRLLRSS